MSKLQELIKELCPDGVEFMRMDEVFEMRNGYTPSKANDRYWNNGTIPWFRMEDIRQNGRILSDSIQHITKEAVKGGRLFPANSFIIATTATIGEHALVIADSLANQRFTNLTIRKSLVEQILVKYLFYYLFIVGEWCKNNTNISGFASVDMSKFRKLEIPLPPLEVQNEIVRILDTFTSHAAELQAELQARKEQYEYYRNKLLTFDENDEGVKWMTLGEIGTFVRGNGLQKKDFTEIGVGCIHYGQIYTYYGTSTDTTKSFVSYDLAQKLTKVKSGNLVIACTSENIEDVCKAVVWLGEEDIVTGGHACVFAHNEIPKYIAYFFQTEYFFQQKKKYARGAKVIDIKMSDLSKISIPIPPLSEQQRIVSILDKFESLVNDLTAGLPAEIAAVQEQYEYYRNKLLTFKRI
ncbi:restriction endonuclease subunit S [Bacteroides sp.]|uniref:restriction endonuclease subunit S n=1 Tax=Bacteroides sp. TaxID=29523 RepID=UPI0025C4CAFA|nr:restriction endonuclease subunit S [Bacteroides sp.]